MSSTDGSSDGPAAAQHGSEFSEQDRARLLAIARGSIAAGLRVGSALEIDPQAERPPLRKPGAAFVTLTIAGQLRGCIGSLEPTDARSLAEDVSDNAFAAAFRDPRFPALTEAELTETRISLSVLGAKQPLACQSEDELLAALRPRLDGVILQAGRRRGTFLPSVWEQLPHPQDFLLHLKRKAGLMPDEWPADLLVWRYRTHSFGEPTG